MLNKHWQFFLALCFLSGFAEAYTGYNICNHGKETLDGLVCYQPTVLKETIVKGDIKVTGTLRAENLSTRGLWVEGNAELRNAVVNAATKIKGSLTAENVEFKRGIAVESSKIFLNQSKVNGMVTVTSPQETPYLQVFCGSSVTGSVLFDGKAGVVQITGDSVVQGKVVNGAMEFVKRNCD